VLVFNVGSSSVKFELRAAGAAQALMRGSVSDVGTTRPSLVIDGGPREALAGLDTPAAAADAVLRYLFGDAPRAAGCAAPGLVATAHRVVHGGSLFRSPVRVTAEVLERLGTLDSLAPLHNPPALAVMRTVEDYLPGLPMVAVFDTTFFRAMPEAAKLYAVPDEWSTPVPIERYGFHGIAHDYLARRVAALDMRRPPRLLTLQLGHGCSITALADGVPVETSMGFTPLEGLVMATRCGDVDAGVLVAALRQGLTWQELDAALERRSGLLALSGVSGDMRTLLELETRGHAGARRAVAAFCHRIGKYVGAYAAVLGGVDAIAFGGGIGELAPSIRARVCEYLRWLGLELDESANARALAMERRVSTARSTIDVYCIPVREESLIAEAALACLDGGVAASGAAQRAGS
jgi:acetate kinase